MKKSIEVKSKLVNFNCVACGKVYPLESTIDAENYSIDVCSNCHPFYLGTTGSAQAKGRSEKLMNKFNTGKSVAKAKKQESSN